MYCKLIGTLCMVASTSTLFAHCNLLRDILVTSIAHWMNPNKEYHDLDPGHSWAMWDFIFECMLSELTKLRQPGLLQCRFSESCRNDEGQQMRMGLTNLHENHIWDFGTHTYINSHFWIHTVSWIYDHQLHSLISTGTLHFSLL